LTYMPETFSCGTAGQRPFKFSK